MSEGPPPLTANAPVPLWFLATAPFEEPGLRERWLAHLEPHERMRHAEYRSAAAAVEYLAARALVRTALAHYAGESADRLRFRGNRGERPELERPSLPGLSFSLAKTRGLVAGLFAIDADVGVDLELVAAREGIEGIEASELSRRFFSPAEQAELATMGEAARRTRFFELWTLREAYLKARGIGLTLPLDQLAFQPTSAGKVRADFGPAIGDDPDRWRFELRWLGESHLAATCIRRGSSPAAARIVPFDAGGLAGATTPRPTG